MQCLIAIDWLIDRRHCDLRWHHQLQDIKSKIKTSLLSLPKNNDIITRIMGKEGMDSLFVTVLFYFQCMIAIQCILGPVPISLL